MTSTRSSSSSMNKALLLAAMLPTATMAQCLSNATVEAFFSPNGETLPAEGSCCMQDICGLTCPPEFPGPKPGKNRLLRYSTNHMQPTKTTHHALSSYTNNTLSLSSSLNQITGYGIAVACSIVISVIVGCAACYLVKGQSVNYFVAGKQQQQQQQQQHQHIYCLHSLYFFSLLTVSLTFLLLFYLFCI